VNLKCSFTLQTPTRLHVDRNVVKYEKNPTSFLFSHLFFMKVVFDRSVYKVAYPEGSAHFGVGSVSSMQLESVVSIHTAM
jgi:hypothetical protein